jgi:hypothetical protein
VDVHEFVDMLHQEHEDRLAKHLGRASPLYDDSLDEAFLNYEWVATRELSRAGSGAVKCESQDNGLYDL